MGDLEDDPAHCRHLAAEFRVKAAQAPSVLMKMSYEALVREYEQRAVRLSPKLPSSKFSFSAPR